MKTSFLVVKSSVLTRDMTWTELICVMRDMARCISQARQMPSREEREKQGAGGTRKGAVTCKTDDLCSHVVDYGVNALVPWCEETMWWVASSRPAAMTTVIRHLDGSLYSQVKNNPLLCKATLRTSFACIQTFLSPSEQLTKSLCGSTVSDQLFKVCTTLFN